MYLHGLLAKFYLTWIFSKSKGCCKGYCKKSTIFHTFCFCEFITLKVEVDKQPNKLPRTCFVGESIFLKIESIFLKFESKISISFFHCQWWLPQSNDDDLSSEQSEVSCLLLLCQFLIFLLLVEECSDNIRMFCYYIASTSVTCHTYIRS